MANWRSPRGRVERLPTTRRKFAGGRTRGTTRSHQGFHDHRSLRYCGDSLQRGPESLRESVICCPRSAPGRATSSYPGGQPSMAQLTFPFTKAGLTVPVWIGLSGEVSSAVLAAGQFPLAPVQARGLLDTASDVTAVASWILQQLAISATSVTSTFTAAGQVNVKLYKVSLGVTDPSQPVRSPVLVFARLAPQVVCFRLHRPVPSGDLVVQLCRHGAVSRVLDERNRQHSPMPGEKGRGRHFAFAGAAIGAAVANSALTPILGHRSFITQPEHLGLCDVQV